MQNQTKDYKFSIIIPIYNVEAYLEQTILSVIGQSCGFEKNVQMILVNDGSPDNSEAICLKYQKQYPENILYIQQQNQGVSAARNHGLQHAVGEYINFLDSDDTWQKDAFEKVGAFFDAHRQQIDVVACQIEYFEAKTGLDHPLNYKFTEDRVIDIQKEHQALQMHAASCFVKRSAISDEFNTNLKFGEDSLFINRIILQKGKYGALQSANYLYRKRQSENSALDTSHEKPEFYVKTLTNFHDNIIACSQEKYGVLLPYVQNLLVYDLGWRARWPRPKGVLTDDEYQAYLDKLHDIMVLIENRYILFSPTHRSIYLRGALLQLKFGEDVLHKLTYRGKTKKLYFNGTMVINIAANQQNCELFAIEHKNGKLYVKGIIRKWIIDADCTTKFVLAFAGQEYPAEIMPFPQKAVQTMFGEKYRFYQFAAEIPFDSAFQGKNTRWLRPRLYFGERKCEVGTSYGTKSMTTTAVCPAAYKIMDDYYCIPTPEGIKFVKPKNMKKAHFRLEKQYCKWLWQNGYKDRMWLRLRYHISRRFRKKPLWIISDRPALAGDNGEAFFKYLAAKKPKDVRYEFVINEDSMDAERLKPFGKVVYFNTKKYQLDFLLADKIISSQANEINLNAFSDSSFVRDLFTFDFVFLQHGVTKDDLSVWLHKRNKDIALFITSSEAEQQSIVHGAYGLEKKNVPVTGMARFDALYNQSAEKQKLVLLMPTWRRSISQSYDENGNSVYFAQFRQTEYFKFFNSLMNDARLLQAMQAHGYTGKFCLHPMHAKQAVDYQQNEIFSVANGAIPYQKLFCEGALLVTDYSSTFFDFCYLRKPVVYTQFDKKEFFEGQAYDPGYFEYERDGFGPVCSTYEETVTQIIRMIENDCQPESVYLDRMNRFYAFSDNRNCSRIEEAIRKYK